MKFYKKNPAISGPVTVQGIPLAVDTVICGEEYAPFADPSTFPGWTPKLVVIPFEELNKKQLSGVQKQVAEKANRPPRHLGVTTSESIRIDGKTLHIPSIPDVTKDVAEKRSENVRKPDSELLHQKVPERNLEDSRDSAKEEKDFLAEKLCEKLPSLRAMYTREMALDTFPGVTERNVDIFLDTFVDLEELAKASKVDLRKAGVTPKFAGRLQKRARFELENRKKK